MNFIKNSDVTKDPANLCHAAQARQSIPKGSRYFITQYVKLVNNVAVSGSIFQPTKKCEPVHHACGKPIS